MPDRMKSEQQQQQQHGDKGLPSNVGLFFSMLTHILLLLPVLYIVGLGFANLTFFAWHPICMALGAGLLLIEGVYAISGEALISKKVSRKNRVTLHWVLHLVGFCLMTIGLVISIVNKNNLNKEHFASTHGQLGLTVFILACVIASFGILANNAQWFYPKIRPVLLKVVHSYAGICMVILLLATVITGTYNKWWIKAPGGTETGRSLVFASLFIAGFLVIVKPVIGAIARTRVLMRPPPSAQSSSNVAAS